MCYNGHRDDSCEKECAARLLLEKPLDGDRSAALYRRCNGRRGVSWFFVVVMDMLTLPWQARIGGETCLYRGAHHLSFAKIAGHRQPHSRLKRYTYSGLEETLLRRARS